MVGNIKNVTVAGSGVLGYQIAFQTAFHGFHVTVYDISEEILDKAKAKFEELAKNFRADLQATDEQIKTAKENIEYSSDLRKAIENADLLIESIPENIQIKTEFYQQLAKIAPEKTIFVSNSSTLLPSQFAAYTGRPEKFLNLHFANRIWLHNTAEIMSHSTTQEEVRKEIEQFAKNIGMVPIVVRKEVPGYVLNSMLSPFLSAALQLWLGQFTTAEYIDKAWMKGTGAPTGPMALYDIIGLTTPYNIYKLQVEQGKKDDQKVVDILEKTFIKPNKLGVSTGEGFYTYPNAAWQQEDFLAVPKADSSKIKIKKVVIAGSGILGLQIAAQAAFYGFDTVIYDLKEEALKEAQTRFEPLLLEYQKYLQANEKQIEQTRLNLEFSHDLENALQDADLLIESIPESLEIKESFWIEVSKYAPEKTIFASNSSTLLPSRIKDFTGRADRYIHLHFANHILVRNIAEIMGSSDTSPEIFTKMVEFAKAINMLPIELKKERAGYVLNSLLVPLLVAGLSLWANDVADPETIDKTWMIATGAPIGPMAILDITGMNTNYNVLKNNPAEFMHKLAHKLKIEFIDKGNLGQQSGKGFYEYPNPAWQQENFLKA
ncbi:3-hydroxyacyl-CoA dehydrogenase [Weeksella virosa]|uniref:3-hydroxyacyl-CoA dehydrogenase n=1 Tax=Weeksella virosa TaxID=1014 RepID=UPI0032B82D22